MILAPKVPKGACIVAATIVALCLAAIAVIEAEHRVKFGHFFSYGIHTDVMPGNSDVGLNDEDIAQIWNLSFTPLPVQGCIEISDNLEEPASVLFRWEVQKWDLSSKIWLSQRSL